MVRSLIFFLVTISAISAVKHYHGYKVYKVIPRSGDDVEVLQHVQNKATGEFWDEQFGVGHEVKIMVAPEKNKDFLYIMTNNGIKVTEVIGDLQRLINDQMEPSNIRTTEYLLSLNWTQYHNLDSIYSWLDELSATYPTIVSTVVMGQSVEGRDIKGIVINYNPDRPEKLIGMIEGTLHAREWISAATVTWIAKEFLTSTNPEVRALAENFEWHIFPVVNPDGYSYTFSDNRMWRKNRNTASFKTCNEGVDDDMSNGVDLNRNFDFHWMSVGATDDSCTNTYAGPSASSEPETAAIMRYVGQLNSSGRIIYYIAFHSYTQLIIVPYSHLSSSADDGRPDNYGDMFEIAQRGSISLAERFGTNYRVGVSAEVMYPMSGTSFDWVKQTYNVPVCYLIELRDLGEFGFLLPRENIVPTALEIMDALLEMDETTREIGYYEQYNSATVSVMSMTIIMAGLAAVLL